MDINSKKQLLHKIEESLNTIRPYLHEDGGDVEVVDLTEEMVVMVKLIGACESCPQSYMTMRAGIEDTVKRAVPEVKGVVALNPNQASKPSSK